MLKTPSQFLFTLILLALWPLLAGCAGGNSSPPPLAFQPTPTLMPTPTLASNAPVLPTPPITPRADSGAMVTEGETAVSPINQPASPTNTPTGPTPQPGERLAIGQSALQIEDFTLAAEQFAAALAEPDFLTGAAQRDALYNLGRATLGDGRYAEAIRAFEQLLLDNAAPDPAHFFLGQAYEAQGRYADAIAAYQRYLDIHPDTAAYVGPIIAANHLALGDRAAAVAAYETAVSAPAHRITAVANRTRLAEFYREDGRFAEAIAQYDAARDTAITEATKGQMTFLAGSTELLAGNTEAGHQRYLEGVRDYPGAAETHQGLVVLVNNGVPVDNFQRGLVNLNAKSFQPAVNAFSNVIAADPAGYRPDTHLYLAYAYEGLGNWEAALAELDKLAASDAPTALIERGRMLARAGNGAAAREAYRAYLAQYPDGADAAQAAWETAVLTARLGETQAAIEAYQTVAANYPSYQNAALGLYRAGWLANNGGDQETAVALWWQAADQYPFSDAGNEALLWLLRTLPEMVGGGETAVVAAPGILPTPPPGEVPTVTPAAESAPRQDAAGRTPTELLNLARARAAASTLPVYGAIRARDLAQGREPFTPANRLNLAIAGDAAAQAEAEAWLRDQLGLAPDAPVRALAPELAFDQRRILGDKLWQIGLRESAKRELEDLRQEVRDNPLASYQLALYFRDLGLYRSSILAAEAILFHFSISVFDAPKFIGRLSYPVYYAEQIVPLADSYGFDPMLQFSLVRQESLYESFARSFAAAQGLSQVIPDTGAWIAQRLNWPNFVNEDLYKPYVGLAFGSYYLDVQLAAFNEHVHAALAAYNAGPGNSQRWYNIAGGDIDRFKETVDFAETRLYIERIYLGHAVYRFLYGE
jgi:soluble lytic murein transglycosylase